MEVIFVEFEDPSVDSSGGIMTYLKNLSRFLMQRGIKTYLLVVDLKGRGCKRLIKNSLFNKFIPLIRKKQTTNV